MAGTWANIRSHFRGLPHVWLYKLGAPQMCMVTLWFDYAVFLIDSCVWMLGPQAMVLFVTLLEAAEVAPGWRKYVTGGGIWDLMAWSHFLLTVHFLLADCEWSVAGWPHDPAVKFPPPWWVLSALDLRAKATLFPWLAFARLFCPRNRKVMTFAFL